MLAPIIAAIIIILLIIYAAFPLLSNKDFNGWANIALTALILFTVILTLFVILGQRKGQRFTIRTIPSTQEETINSQENPALKTGAAAGQTFQDNKTQEPQEISDEEALMAITKEYLQAEETYKAQGDKNYQQKAAQQIIDRYDFTQEDWQTFLEDAARYDLFNKAKEEMK